jgi:hypothetical protein
VRRGPIVLISIGSKLNFIYAHQEPAVESLSALPFDSIMSSPSFGSICPAAGLPFHLSAGRVVRAAVSMITS